VVGGLAADIGEQVPQPVGHRSQPAAFGVVAEQGLRDRQPDELGVRQLGWMAWSPAGFEQVINGDVQCDDEVVEVSVHTAPRIDGAIATPILGGLATSVTPRHPQPESTSGI
jgi:hypothetical protein